MIIRKIECDICHVTAEEITANAGWPGWGALHGIELDGVQNPTLCPSCLAKVASYIDTEMKH